MQDPNTSTPTTLAFAFEGHAFRVVIDDDGTPWFNANDVCEVLEFGNPRQALDSHVDPDDVQKLDTIDSLGRAQPTNHLNESGVYGLIFGSPRPEAKRVKRWVTREVLPAIRKTGRYQLPGLQGHASNHAQPVGVVTFRERGLVVIRAEGVDYLSVSALSAAVGFDVFAFQIEQDVADAVSLYAPRSLDRDRPTEPYLRLDLVGLALARLCIDKLALSVSGDSLVAIRELLALNSEWAETLAEHQNPRAQARLRRSAAVRHLMTLVRARDATKAVEDYALFDALVREAAAQLGHPMPEPAQRALPL